MKRRFRLTKSTDFKRVRRFGKSYTHPLIVLVTFPNERSSSRFAVTAGRSVGTAISRNRAKRLMRAAIHPYLDSIQGSRDAILIARRSVLEADFLEIQKAIQSLLSRAELLKNDVG